MRRWAAAAVLLLAAVYVTMPWWLPTRWLARRFTQQLVRALHRPVTIGSLHVSWNKGVVITDLVVGARVGTMNTQLAAVHQLKCGFSPLTTLFTGRVDRLELVDPQIWLVLDETGRIINLPDMQNDRAGSLPSHRYSITKARCHLVAPETAPQTVLLDQIDCEIFPDTGLLRLQGWTAVPRLPKDSLPALAGRFNFDARVNVARLNPNQAFGGQISAEWTDLALTDLPQPFAARVPIQQLEGLTSGRLHLTPQPDLAMDFQVALNLNGVKIVRPGAPKPAHIPDASLHTEGRWDPNTDKIALQEFDYETAGLRIHRKKDLAAPAISYDPRGPSPFVMHLAGVVKDWSAFRREFPEIDQLTGTADTNLTGSAQFTFSLIQEEDQNRFVATLDATPSQWLLRTPETDWLALQAGLRKNLHIEAVHNRHTRQVSHPQVLCQLGDLTLMVQSELLLPAGESPDWLSWIAEALPTLGSTVELQTEHIEDILQWMPFTQHISSLNGCSGPVEMIVSLDPAEEDSLLKLNIDFKPETRLELGRLFAKPAGAPLSVQAAARVPHAAAGEWHALQFELITGRSRLGLISERSTAQHDLNFARQSESPTASLEQLARRIESFDSIVDLTIHAAYCEDWLPFFPMLRGTTLSDVLAGNAQLRIDSRFSLDPGEWCLMNGLTVKTDNLKLNVGDILQKPTGTPFDLEINHRIQSVDSQLETTLAAMVQTPAGRFIATTTINPGDTFEHTAVEAEVSECAACSALSPALQKLLEPYQITGPVSFKFSSVAFDDSNSRLATQNLSFSADLSGARFTLPDNTPFKKAAGVPARIEVHLRNSADPELQEQAKKNDQRWNVDETSHAQLAGAKAQLAGEIALGKATTPLFIKDLLTSTQRERGPLMLPAFQSARIETKGELTFDPQLTALHPKLREWTEAYAIAGKTNYSLAVDATPGRLHCTGNLDAQPIAFSFSLPNAFVPQIQKPAVTPATLVFNIALNKQPSPTGNAYALDVHDATLQLAGNTFTAGGIAHWRAQSPLALAEASIGGTIDMLKPEALTALLPGCALAPLTGSGQAAIRFDKELSGEPDAGAKLTFQSFTMKTPAEPIQLDGAITLNAQNIDIDQLRYEWGPSAGTAAIHLISKNGGYTGHIGLAIDQLDLVDLQRKLTTCTNKIAGPGSPSNAPNVRKILDVLSHSNIDFKATAGTLNLALPLDVVVQVDSATVHANIESGNMDMAFRCLVDGGATTGTFKTRMDVADPSYHLRYTSERIQPGPLVDRYLTLTFPGMKAAGPLTLVDETIQKILPAESEDNFPVGKGEIIIEGGTVEGRAAPVWVTNIFPGLNMAQFEFSYMHTWFEKLPNGRIHHQMIFQGRFYNIYMIGYGEPDGRIDYEIGIDFLADFNSKYWAQAGQGRIPLFNKTGRKLPNGQLIDEVVTYIPPHRIFETLLVRNNLVFTAYHAVRKRVLKEQ